MEGVASVPKRAQNPSASLSDPISDCKAPAKTKRHGIKGDEEKKSMRNATLTVKIFPVLRAY
jgi:hypothetical protein